MSSKPSRSFSPRRAHFSTDGRDGSFTGLDETLLRAAMADQASLQTQSSRCSRKAVVRSQPQEEIPDRDSSTTLNPFLPNYSLAVRHQDRGQDRLQSNRPVSPLELVEEDTQSIVYSTSPDNIHEEENIRSRPSQSARPQLQGPHQGRKYDLPHQLSEGNKNSTSRQEEKEEEDQVPTSLSFYGSLGERRPSRLYHNKIHTSSQETTQDELSQMPRLPPQTHSYRPRMTSEGSYLPSYSSQSHRTSSHSFESVHASQPHIQRYDPQSSPSMVQLFSPRLASSGSFRSSLKPSISRQDTKFETAACELGMAGVEGKSEAKSCQGGGIRGAFSGLVNRVISTDHKADEDDDDKQRNYTNGAGIVRPSSAQSECSTVVKSRRSSMCSDVHDEKRLDPRDKERRNLAFILGEDDEPREADDPRSTGAGRKSVDMRRHYDYAANRRASYSSEYCDQEVKPHRRNRSLANLVGPLKNFGAEEDPEKRPSIKSNHSSLKSHMAERQKLILKLSRALMLFGAPSHRVESQLNALSQVLGVDGQYIHFPGIVIASFGDVDNHTSECHFVKSKTELALGHLTEVHGIYKAVIMDKMSVYEATKELNRLLKAKPEWSILSRVAFNAIRCGIMAPMSFGGSFVDVFVAAAFGSALTFTQLYFAGKNPLFSNVFEITAAIVISFISRLLSTNSVFCYQSIASAGLILVLPGYVILCGSLELASKNMIAGSVRMVYAIIYSLFIGFGVAIGSDLYFVVDPAARKSIWVPLNTQTEVSGSFTFANETLPHWSGQFTFSNGTKNALNTGSINCERLPEWPWYRQPVTPYLNIAFVPIFSLLACFSLLHPFKSREVPVSVIIACIGYTTNYFANHYIFNRSDVVSAIGSFVIGLLGNAYSRLYDATAFTAMTVAVLFLVPSGMAMAGGLAMTYKGSDGDLYSNGLSIGLRMVQVSIGITTGLFASALLVYMFGNKRKNAQLFAF